MNLSVISTSKWNVKIQFQNFNSTYSYNKPYQITVQTKAVHMWKYECIKTCLGFAHILFVSFLLIKRKRNVDFWKFLIPLSKTIFLSWLKQTRKRRHKLKNKSENLKYAEQKKDIDEEFYNLEGENYAFYSGRRLAKTASNKTTIKLS